MLTSLFSLLLLPLLLLFSVVSVVFFRNCFVGVSVAGVLDGGNVLGSCLLPAPLCVCVCLWPGLRVARFWLWLLSLAALLCAAAPLLCSALLFDKRDATRRDASEQSQPTFCCATTQQNKKKNETKK